MTRTIHSYSKKISDNKSFESELYIDRNYRFFYSIFESEFKLLNLNNFISIRLRIFGDLFALNFRITRKEDHAGLHFYFKFLPIEGAVSYYDTRHWDYENDKWVIYNV